MENPVISENIAKIVAAADALGAPHFSTDIMKAAAKQIENRIDKQYETWPAGPLPYTEAEEDELKDDLKTIMKGAEAAMAFIACPFLPDELAECRESDAGNKLIIDAIRISKKYT